MTHTHTHLKYHHLENIWHIMYALNYMNVDGNKAS